jgi:multisubunit Na+/H+ antiporter MnhC subunit
LTEIPDLQIIKFPDGKDSWLLNNRNHSKLIFGFNLIPMARFTQTNLMTSSGSLAQSHYSAHGRTTASPLMITSIFTATVLLGALTIFGAVKAKSTVRPALQANEFHPTSLPWVTSQSECDRALKVWDNGKCWDYQNRPDF